MARIDWQAVHDDYRAGQLSLRVLAAKHGTHEATIRKRAKAEGWQRDLSQHVRAATNAKLVRSESTHSDAYLPDDGQALVEAAADTNVAVVLDHREAIRRWKAISNRLAHALGTTHLDESNTADFARSLNSGIDALGKAIRLERQAFNLDAKGQGDEGQTFEQLMKSVAPLTDDELDARILVLSAKVNDQTP